MSDKHPGLKAEIIRQRKQHLRGALLFPLIIFSVAGLYLVSRIYEFLPGLLFLIPVLLTLAAEEKRVIFITASACSLLVLTDQLFWPSVYTTSAELSDDFLVAGVLFLAAVIRSKHGCISCGDLPEVPGDAVQLRQLFSNIISNALKYHKKDQPPQLNIQSRDLRNGFVEIRFQDQGPGMDPAQCEAAFEPFKRLRSDKKKVEGTGLGLAICKRIVLRHRGNIRAESVPGEGTSFIITLPKGDSPLQGDCPPYR